MAYISTRIRCGDFPKISGKRLKEARCTVTAERASVAISAARRCAPPIRHTRNEGLSQAEGVVRTRAANGLARKAAVCPASAVCGKNRASEAEATNWTCSGGVGSRAAQGAIETRRARSANRRSRYTEASRGAGRAHRGARGIGPCPSRARRGPARSCGAKRAYGAQRLRGAHRARGAIVPRAAQRATRRSAPICVEARSAQQTRSSAAATGSVFIRTRFAQCAARLPGERIISSNLAINARSCARGVRARGAGSTEGRAVSTKRACGA